MDKDTIVNAVGASHDIHLLKIDNREDELVTRVNSWCTRLVDQVSRCHSIKKNFVFKSKLNKQILLFKK